MQAPLVCNTLTTITLHSNGPYHIRSNAHIAKEVITVRLHLVPDCMANFDPEEGLESFFRLYGETQPRRGLKPLCGKISSHNKRDYRIFSAA